jgi:hypothetical protein
LEEEERNKREAIEDDHREDASHAELVSRHVDRLRGEGA